MQDVLNRYKNISFKHDYWMVLFLSVFVFAVCAYRIPSRVGLYLSHDEFALFGIAAYFIGYDWSYMLPRVLYYSFGYPLLLTPGFLLANSPGELYSYSLYLNSFLASLMAPLLYLLCKRWGVSNFKSATALIILFSTLTGAVIAYSNLGLGEVLLVVLTCAITLCFYKLHDESPKARWFVVQAFLLAYLFTVHMRTLGVLIAATIVIVLMVVLKRIKVKHGMVFFATLLLLLTLNLLIANYIKEYVWLGMAGGNDLDSRMSQFFSVITEWDRFIATVRSVGGQLFYLGVSSFTLIFFAVQKLIGHNVKFFRNIKVEKNSFDFTLLFLLLAFLGSLAISSIAVHETVRGDHFIYGRYNSSMEPIFLLYLLVEAKKERFNFSKLNIIVTITGFVLLSAWVIQFFLRNYVDRMFMDFNVINLSWFKAVSDNMADAFRLAILASTIIGLAIIIPLGTHITFKYKKIISSTALALGLLIAFLSANAFHNGHPGWSPAYWDNFSWNTRLIINEMEHNELPVYLLTGPHNPSHIVSFLQFELFNRTLRFTDDLTHLQNEEFYFFVENPNAISILFNTNINRTLVGATSMHSLFKSDGNVPVVTLEETFDLPLTWFSSHTAALIDRGLVSDGALGWAMFGPRIRLPKGAYETDFTLSIDKYEQEELGYIDIITQIRGQTRTLFRRHITSEDFQTSPQTFTLPFSLFGEVLHTEFRANTTEGTVLVIENVTLRRLSPYPLLVIEDFETHNGTFRGGIITSNGERGFLIFGNRISPPSGSYTYTVEMLLHEAPETGNSIGFVDISASFGEDILLMIPIYADDFTDNSLILTLPVDIIDEEDLEVRVFTNDYVILSVTSVVWDEYLS